MTKGVIKKYESTRCKIGSYYIREHICAIIHDAIVDSNGMKTNVYLDNPVDILNTPATQSVNVLYIESMFHTFSDDIKKQMDITEFINTISKQNIIPACKYAGEIGNVELTFTQTCSITGTLTISYNWRKFSEFETYANDTELHTINGVIKYNKRYYAITPLVIELLQGGVPNTTDSGEHVTLAKMLT